MPQVETVRRAAQVNYPVLSVQSSWPGSSGPFAAIAVFAWVGLLAIGAWSAVKGSAPVPWRKFLVLGLAAQLALHVVFGEETFLFAMHFTPLLILLAATGAETRFRRGVLSLATVLLLFGAVNNWQQFTRSLDLAGHIEAQATP
jgi:hypothetical protein